MRSGKEALFLHSLLPLLQSNESIRVQKEPEELVGFRLTASPRSFLVGELVVQGCSFSLFAS